MPRVLLGLTLLCSTTLCASDDLPAIVDYVAAHREPTAVASIPWDRYEGDLRSLPIGVFDSGIGGLTVLEAILKLDAYDNATGRPTPDGVADFANEKFIYLGDQANMPYGNYSSVGRVDFLRELIVRDLLFLLGDRFDGGRKPPVKAIVIACNTATAYGLDDLRAALERWKLPIIVIGVVEAGGRGTIDVMRRDTQAGTAAVLATVGTCASGAYPRTITRLAGQQGLQAPQVVQFGSPGLAAAIEGTAGSVDDCLRTDVAALVAEHRRSGDKRPITTVVLGCTHYPLVRDDIDREFMRVRDDPACRDLIAPQLTYVNPADETARELFRELFLRRLRAGADVQPAADRDAFYITVGRDGLLSNEVKFGRSPGRFDVQDIRTIPMHDDPEARAALKPWATRLPHVAERLGNAQN